MKKKCRMLLAPDTLFYKTPDGKYWSDTIYSYNFFERYMDIFDTIVIASRCKVVDYKNVIGFLRSDGPNIEVCELPNMRGMSAYIRNIIAFSRAAKKSCENVDCAIIRLPSVPASMVLHYFKKTKKPYSLEIVADPYDAYATNKMARLFFSRHMRRACRQANGVSYVTKFYLQNKYPGHNRTMHKNDSKYFESYYSTIRISEEYYSKPRNYFGKKHFTIIHTANNMNNNLKGHEVVIRAAEIVLKDGFDIDIKFVGDGELKKYFEELARQLGIGSKVSFTGMLANAEEVRKQLLEADLLVFPTKAEGLPRSVIESMAVGLPCISTPIAGIPELLTEEDMIEPNDIVGFAKRIEEFITNPEMMNQKSKRNIEVARNYREDILKERRDAFYRSLKELID